VYISATSEIGANASDGCEAGDANGDRDSDGKIDFSTPPIENSKADAERNKEGKRNVKELSIIAKTRISVRGRRQKKNKVIADLHVVNNVALRAWDCADVLRFSWLTALLLIRK
jgi:hypothetical protein